jgi:hypothetical protein
MIEFSTAFWLTFGFSIFTFVVGYYFGERGFQGVQNDLNNVKVDVAHIKGSLSGPVVPTVTPIPSVTTVPVVTSTGRFRPVTTGTVAT